jgi:hypothetical protein
MWHGRLKRAAPCCLAASLLLLAHAPLHPITPPHPPSLRPPRPPPLQVEITAAILRDAEVGIDTYAAFNWTRNFTPKPMPTLEVRLAGGGGGAEPRPQGGSGDTHTPATSACPTRPSAAPARPAPQCIASSAVKAAIDMSAAAIALFTNCTAPCRALAKYRPSQASAAPRRAAAPAQGA